jgi:hypothetical protein
MPRNEVSRSMPAEDLNEDLAEREARWARAFSWDFASVASSVAIAGLSSIGFGFDAGGAVEAAGTAGEGGSWRRVWVV